MKISTRKTLEKIVELAEAGKLQANIGQLVHERLGTHDWPCYVDPQSGTCCAIGAIVSDKARQAFLSNGRHNINYVSEINNETVSKSIARAGLTRDQASVIQELHDNWYYREINKTTFLRKIKRVLENDGGEIGEVTF